MSVRRWKLFGVARFEDQDLTDAEFRECDLTRARLIGVVMQDAVGRILAVDATRWVEV